MPNANFLTNGKYQTFGAGLQTPPHVRWTIDYDGLQAEGRNLASIDPAQTHVSCPVPAIYVGVRVRVPVAFGTVEVTVTTPVAGVIATPLT